ncbi:MAG: aminopeptidase P family protein [Candidatus Azobacteroides sp.]|nr:aminopeptidase P family protein [Candidatus Azobacteroides sp.]
MNGKRQENRTQISSISTSPLEALREIMHKENVHACMIPTTDPHIGEYTPDHWKTRQWISGFTGSAGTVAVTLDKAGLWTDSRYFLQAENQLRHSGIELFRMGLPGVPTPEEWIKNQLSSGNCVAFEGSVYAASDALSLSAYFEKYRIQVQSDFAPYDAIWKNRPAIPLHKAFILSDHFSGENARSKISRLLNEMRANACDCTLLASLDSIAWLFNLRGNDIEYNPVSVCYAVVSEKEIVLFIDPQKLTPETTEYLQNEGILLAEYETVYPYIQNLSSETCVLITPNKINYRLYTAIPKSCTIKELSTHPVDRLKSVKNETEIAGFRNAMQRDGVAWMKFLYGLNKQMDERQTITELDVSRQLKKFRSEQVYFFSESFETIAAYGAHSAIVHYSPTEETNVPVLPEGILLIDSGAQYFDGTTDITRSLATGAVTDEMKKDFTHLLKGNIQLSCIAFPQGTVGTQLDVLARQFIWKEGQNFLHGTGHGVGHFLNVHEGPQSIRMNYNPTELQPGMVVSNEPGLYKAGQYGIRIENLLLVIPYRITEFGEYYAFEILTLCPIDKKLIDWSLMSPEEIRWLNDYHQKVYDCLSPFLSEEERDFLFRLTEPESETQQKDHTLAY